VAGRSAAIIKITLQYDMIPNVLMVCMACFGPERNLAGVELLRPYQVTAAADCTCPADAPCVLQTAC
jgi:hypothetical protein